MVKVGRAVMFCLMWSLSEISDETLTTKRVADFANIVDILAKEPCTEIRTNDND